MELILKYFPDLSLEQIKQFQALKDGVIDWNAKINVISRKEMEEIEERHILHSLAIAKFHQFNSGTRLIDVGTGGGFPGLPLAILFPDCHFTLVDSIGKKIKVVNELVQLTGLKNVTTMNCRAESVRDRFDFVLSRAVTSFPTFYSWTRGLLKQDPGQNRAHKPGGKPNDRAKQRNNIKNGIISLKGGDLSEELINFRKTIQIEAISQWYNEAFFETKYVLYLPFKGANK